MSNDASTYMTSPYLAGINYIFAAPREFCDNCGQQDEVGQLASDTHPITPLLLDYLNRTDNHLDSLEPVHVKPFLVNNLRWRVVYVRIYLPFPISFPPTSACYYCACCYAITKNFH